MSDLVKKFSWGHSAMIPYNETAERLGLTAYVRIENYQFTQKMAENLKAENSSLKAEVERLRKAGDAVKDAVETYFELMPMLVTEVRAKAMLKGRKAIKEWKAAKEGKPSV